jgi:tryptophan 2,3-dioxygenase
MYEFIYWKAGATELESGKKTYTLTQFEERYDTQLLQMAEELKGKTFISLFQGRFENETELRDQLRFLDQNVNVNWPLVHYKTAVRYLSQKEGDIAATGGSNWQQYLPPRFQKRIFYPGLWEAKEKEEWGKGWVEAARG